MIEHRPFNELGGEDHGWLKAKHHFSFADYADPARMGWGSLRVWNDDEIASDTGFPPHPHANMEIITYVREGAVTHKDSLGNEGRTEAGDVQVMSAGTGIRHAEYNLEQQPTRIFQIWIIPGTKGGSPAWGSQPFPKADRSGRLVTLASGFDNDRDALPIRARARVLGAMLKTGETVEYALDEGRYGYLVPASGTVEVNGARIDARDGAAIKDVGLVRITAIEDSEVVIGRRPVEQCGAPNTNHSVLSKVLVLYYSSYGHIEAMANAVAEGARQAGAHAPGDPPAVRPAGGGLHPCSYAQFGQDLTSLWNLEENQ